MGDGTMTPVNQFMWVNSLCAKRAQLWIHLWELAGRLAI